MADLRAGGGAGPTTSNGNDISSSRPRPAGAPAPTGSPSGIRGPRMIMQERAAREAARQKAEQEKMQLERERAREEARQLEETQRRNSERRAAAAAAATAGASDAAGTATGGRASGAAPEHITQQHNNPNLQGRISTGDAPAPRPSASSRRQEAASHQGQPRVARTTPAEASAPAPTSTPQQSHAFPGAIPQAGVSQPQAGGVGGSQQRDQNQTSGAGGPSGSRPRNTFPHAFERWETLSAHWEGLTNFWIRRLEQNNEDIDRDPINQALSRQVTDLSAAGANLFHAVVELQRLRASSERKFQRWFFETRAELERSQEVNAMLENALNEERRARADAIAEAVAKEQANSMNKTRFEEMRKELQISKEEARRAWEELGRREQESRERTASLQSGQPTIVGGVQVVPMTQGVPSRHGSAQQGGYRSEHAGQQSGYTSSYSPEANVGSPPPPPVPTTTDGGYYTQQGGALPAATQYSGGAGGSEGGYSEGEYEIDAQGHYVRDQHGNKVPFQAPPSPVSDDGAEDPETPGANPPRTTYPPAPTAPTSQTQYYSQPQDYSGQGYAAPGWETVPRHHHPTRLSDVIEEDDERSRTSRTSASYSRV